MRLRGRWMEVFATRRTREVRFVAKVVVTMGQAKRQTCLCDSWARPLPSCADMQGRAKWAWLEDRRCSSQLCAGQAMVRVGHEAMRVRRPSSAVPFGLPIRCTRVPLDLCGEDGRKQAWVWLLPTQDAEAGSTLTRGKPHIAGAHNVYLCCYCWSLLSSHMHRAIARVRAIGTQAQTINQYRQQRVRMKHHLMIGTWYVLWL